MDKLLNENFKFIGYDKVYSMVIKNKKFSFNPFTQKKIIV